MWIVAPTIAQLGENCSEMYFPKRDELWLRCVFAQPNASRSGLDCIIRVVSALPAWPPSSAGARHTK